MDSGRRRFEGRAGTPFPVWPIAGPDLGGGGPSSSDAADDEMGGGGKSQKELRPKEFL